MPVILMVEDNLDNRAIYRMILEHHGYKVIEAGDGQAGVAAARHFIPDLILMDISMPIMNGWEALEVLKSDELTGAIPVVALTAHALKTDEERAHEAGFDRYIAKPVEPMRVVEVVRNIVGPGRESRT